MKGWRECKLGDIAEFKNGKSRPSDFEIGIIPIYGGNGILGYTAISNYLDEGIIIGRVGAYCGSVFYENRPIWVSDNALFCVPKNKFNAIFLYYFLKNMDLNQVAEGSSHPLITQTLLNSLDVYITDSYIEQCAIAGVLSSLDDKIDLLHRQNKTLEGMAEAVWRKMFVEEASSKWETKTIAEVAGINEKSIGREYSFAEIEYLDTGSITEGMISQYQPLSLKEAPSRAKRIVRKNDILLSMVRPIQKHYGILKNIKENAIASTGFAVITCKKIDPHFIYLLLIQKEMTEFLEIIAEGSTTTYPSLVPSDIAKIDFLMPPAALLALFSAYASAAWDKIDKNQSQIRILSQLRDALLPKLMSGEIRVNA